MLGSDDSGNKKSEDIAPLSRHTPPASETQIVVRLQPTMPPRFEDPRAAEGCKIAKALRELQHQFARVKKLLDTENIVKAAFNAIYCIISYLHKEVPVEPMVGAGVGAGSGSAGDGASSGSADITLQLLISKANEMRGALESPEAIRIWAMVIESLDSTEPSLETVVEEEPGTDDAAMNFKKIKRLIENKAQKVKALLEKKAQEEREVAFDKLTVSFIPLYDKLKSELLRKLKDKKPGEEIPAHLEIMSFLRKEMAKFNEIGGPEAEAVVRYIEEQMRVLEPLNLQELEEELARESEARTRLARLEEVSDLFIKLGEESQKYQGEIKALEEVNSEAERYDKICALHRKMIAEIDYLIVLLRYVGVEGADSNIRYLEEKKGKVVSDLKQAEKEAAAVGAGEDDRSTPALAEDAEDEEGDGSGGSGEGAGSAVGAGVLVPEEDTEVDPGSTGVTPPTEPGDANLAGNLPHMLDG